MNNKYFKIFTTLILINITLALFGMIIPNIISSDKIPYYAIIINLTTVLTLFIIIVFNFIKILFREPRMNIRIKIGDEDIDEIVSRISEEVCTLVIDRLSKINEATEDEKIKIDLTIKFYLLTVAVRALEEVHKRNGKSFDKKGFIQETISRLL